MPTRGEPRADARSPDPHRDQDDDQRLEQRVRLLVLAAAAPTPAARAAAPRRSAPRSAARGAASPLRRAQLVALDEDRPDRPADQSARDDADHRRGDRTRRRRRARPPPRTPARTPGRSPVRRSASPSRSARRTAGACPAACAMQDADDVLRRPRAPSTSRKKSSTCGPPTLSSDRLAPKPTVVKNAIINGACSRVSNGDQRPAPRDRGDQHRHRDQQPADDRRRHVVARQRRNEPRRTP